MRLDKFTLAISALFLALTPAAPAQSPASTAPPSPGVESNLPGAGFDAPESTTPIIRVSAQEVIVDVIVTDASGKAIHGLKASDFTVTENGKPQIIRSLYENTGAGATSKFKVVPLFGGEYTNSYPLPVGGTINIFLLDPAPPPEANGWILNSLRKLPKNTPVGIYALAPSGLHTLQPITIDREQLIRALSVPVYDRGAGVPLTERETAMIRLRGFNELAAFLSGIRGRKNLFWFASGFSPPALLMRDGGLSFGADSRSEDTSLVHHTMDTYEMLTAAQVAVYPVFPPLIHHAPTPNLLMTLPPGFSQASFPDLSLALAQEEREDMPGLELEKIAEDFGTVNIDRGNPNSIAEAVDRASTYYSLSYLPPKERFDGHYHHITVTANRPGLTLSYRKGYNSERTPTIEDPAPGAQLMKASMEGNALGATQILFDAAIRPSPLPTPAATEPPTSDAKLKKTKASKAPPPKTFSYQIAYGFPASQIAFLEDEYGKLHGAVEFDVVAYDVRRARVALLTQTAAIPLGWDQFDQFAASRFQFSQKIDLPPGQLWIHVGIIDTVSDRVGTLEFPLFVDGKPAMPFHPQFPPQDDLRPPPVPQPHCSTASCWSACAGTRCWNSDQDPFFSNLP